MNYPTELIAKAKYELEVFDRVAADTGAELVAEVVRLREMLEETGNDCTHKCVKCLHSYTPVGANEDCPHCGCDGIK